MAHTDTAAGISAESSGILEIKSEGPNHVVDLTSEAATEGPDTNPSTLSTTSTPSSSPPTKNANSDAASIPQTTRSTLVPLGSSSSQGTTPAPQPKRFSAVNITKKFLEKNGPNSSSIPTASPFSSLKSGSSTSKPIAPSTTSHPRLITTKLTANPQLSSSSGPGWSRPSSVTPPVANANATTPNGTTHPIQNSSTKATNSAVSGPPQPPLPGKVIQPQPRTAAASIGLNKNSSAGSSSSKPAWASMRPVSSNTRAPFSDFPTAAEVAQGRTHDTFSKRGVAGRVFKAAEMKETEEASKQARMEEADTFRGVHLDPNAHHWDEMEEDDDNFLDSVIDFGDGRQYNVDTNITPPSPPESKETPARSPSRFSTHDADISNGPVSKEDRFVDDFDRSWPRSGPSSHPSRNSNASDPSVSPHASHSPQESSRVLFNERSNKLEPYNGSARSTQSSAHYRRTHQPDSPNDSRGPRISPTASSSNHNFQLLQKSSNKDGPLPTRRYSNSGTGPFDRHRDGDFSRRDHPIPSSRTAPHLGPGEQRDRGRQQSSMPPPPVPPHALRGKERQLPPHLSQPGSVATPFERRASSRESRYSAHTNQPPGPPSAASSVRHPSQSPALSHRSLAPVSSSPVIDPAALNLSIDELESAKKNLMHDAAARAKHRRQQEEEEREREKERARQKALELEKRFPVQKEPNQDDVCIHILLLFFCSLNQMDTQEATQIIQDAIKAAKSEIPSESASQDQIPPTRHSLQRYPSTRSTSSQTHGTERGLFGRRSSVSSRISTGDAASIVSVAASAESWRRAPPSTSKIDTHVRTQSLASQAPSVLDQVQSLAEDPDAELEIVDYSDLGKFVGDHESEQPSADHAAPLKSKQRPVASDFLDDESPPAADKKPLQTVDKSDDRIWRRGSKSTVVDGSSERPNQEARLDTALVPTPGLLLPMQKDIPTAADVHPTSPPASHPTGQRHQRPSYKEPTMSALDDAMSRIKGALDGMHGEKAAIAEADSVSKKLAPTPVSKAAPPKDSQPSPPRRSQQVIKEPPENFLYTCSEPPQSPKPAWNAFPVKLPKTSAPLEPINRRRLNLFFTGMHFRWDILSFTPHVEGMSRRDFSVNDVLFRKTYVYGQKGKLRYRVSFPNNAASAPMAPRVNIPGHPSRQSTTGAFGRPTGADGVSTWRKRSTLAVEITPTELDTTSRSPPPEPVGAVPPASPGKSQEQSVSSPTNDPMTPSRLRSQPKMPAGSGVAFLRDSKIVEVDSHTKPAVSFFAVNDADASRSEKVEAKSEAKPEATSSKLVNGSSAVDSGSKLSALSPNTITPPVSKFSLPPLVSSKAESKSSEDSPDRMPITPPHPGGTWSRTSLSLPVKDTPVRGPDPEHLKAVWSQPSNKADLHPVNSLEGIADDLTALPFTLLDVKSEDGATPPPTLPSAPSRMSLHDVTRAFQQVPTSSSTSSNGHRPPISPPSTTAPVARPPQGYNYTQPNIITTPNVRPNYQYHPSPMMSHSPAPALYHPMNGSPVPARMGVNGPTPLYSPVWMPLPNPTGQNPNPMMRPPMSSPYPPVMYPSPGPQQMYLPPAMQNVPGQPPQASPHNTLGRGRGNPTMMSPAMQHAGAVPSMPMYSGSPVMMPAHAGRPPIRNDNVHHPTMPQPPLPNPQHYPSVHGPSSFNGVRPSW
ncbi:hypothetical protein VNI00_001922 [Paramarasmius palmivorus]|uniref:Uncharacterized protein n=1 Tax=Paramarasmius palmivorus TaxID=297713 RepID=A0AAW0E4W0_9AGAR